MRRTSYGHYSGIALMIVSSFFLTAAGKAQERADGTQYLACPVANCGFVLQGLSPDGMRFEFSTHNLAMHDQKISPAEVEASFHAGEAVVSDSTLLRFVCESPDMFGVWSRDENEVMFIAGVHMRLAHKSDIADEALRLRVKNRQ